jgi:8-oxo-dGTP diphosphatase
MQSSRPSAINVVAALMFRHDQLLICQRHHAGSFPLKWEFPGGKVEAGESDCDALRRELKEELAIDMIEARPALQHEHSYSAGPKVALRFYNVHEFAGEPHNLVFEQISWVALSALKDFDFLEGDRLLVDQLASDRGREILAR